MILSLLSELFKKTSFCSVSAEWKHNIQIDHMMATKSQVCFPPMRGLAGSLSFGFRA